MFAIERHPTFKLQIFVFIPHFFHQHIFELLIFVFISCHSLTPAGAKRCLLPSFSFIHQLTITMRQEHTTLTTNATDGWERAVLCIGVVAVVV